MRVLSLVNQKGGCGKTTVAINLGAALAARSKRVLVIDIDPQAHATLGLGLDGEDGPSLADVLRGHATPREALRRAPCGLAMIAGSARLAEFEEESATQVEPERVLRHALEELAGGFDFALIDCPARADGVLTANALYASTTAVLVVETGAFALQGALRALALFDDLARAQGSSFDLRVLGTLFDRRTRFARELLVALQSRFGREMYDTVVRTSVRLREAAAAGKPVLATAPRSGAAVDFAALADEVCLDVLARGSELEAASDSSAACELTPPPREVPRPLPRREIRAHPIAGTAPRRVP
jgi:chromosome partitioning protein